MKQRQWLFFLCLICLPMLSFAADSSHALDSLRFVPPDSDLSVNYLSSIFGVVGGVLSGTSTQLMGKMFGIFNAAALTLAGIIVMYVLIASTLNTAHEGELMGKRWSSIWIPLRTAFGIGLLLPQASGYSQIQIFMMWVVVQGIGVADSIWDTSLTYLQQGGVIISRSHESSFKDNTDASDLAKNMFAAVTCMAGLQDQLNKLSQADRSMPAPPNLIASVNPANVDIKTSSIPMPDLRSLGKESPYAIYTGACGKLGWQGPTNTDGIDTTPLVEARKTALQQMLLDFTNPANRIISNFQRPLPIPIGFCPKGQATCDSDNWSTDASNPSGDSVLPGNLLINAFTDYIGITNPAVRRIYDHVKADTKWIDNSRKQGWILAGSYYYKLSQFNNDVSNKTDKLIPYANAGRYATVDAICDDHGTEEAPNPFLQLDPDSAGDNHPRCKALRTSLFLTPLYGSNIGSVPAFLDDATNHYGLAQGQGGAQQYDAGKTGVHGVFGKVINGFIGALGKLLKSFRTLSQITGTDSNQNPLLVLTTIGQALLSVVTDIWLVGLFLAPLATALGAITCVNLSNMVLVVTAWVIPLLTVIMTLMFAAGLLLAYYVPLIPFIVFTMGAIGWMISVVEAMVAGPLVALAIIYPEGHEVWGRADQAIMLTANILLRPGLMVIGLMAGISISYVGIWLLNQGFVNGQEMIYSTKFGSGNIWYPACITIVYTALAVAVVTKAFSLIYVLPDKVIRWMGGHPDNVGQEAAGEAMGMVKGGAGQFSQAGGQVAQQSAREYQGAAGQMQKASKQNDAAGGVAGNLGSGSELQVGENGGGGAGMGPP